MNPNKENIDPNKDTFTIFDCERIIQDYGLQQRETLPTFVSTVRRIEESIKRKEERNEKRFTHELLMKNENNEEDEYYTVQGGDDAKIDAIALRCLILPLPKEDVDDVDQAVEDKVFPPPPLMRTTTLTITKENSTNLPVLMRTVPEKTDFANALYGERGFDKERDCLYNTYALFLPLKSLRMCLVFHSAHPMKRFLLRYANIWRGSGGEVVEDSYSFKIWSSGSLTRCQCKLTLTKHRVLFPRGMYPSFYVRDIMERWYNNIKPRRPPTKRQTDAEFVIVEGKRIHRFSSDVVPRTAIDHVVDVHGCMNDMVKQYVDFIRLMGSMVTEERFVEEFSSLLTQRTKQDVADWFYGNACSIVLENNIENDARFSPFMSTFEVLKGSVMDA